VRRAALRSILAWLSAVAAAPSSARAALPFPSVVERVVSARVDIAPVRRVPGGEPASWRVEMADVALHGVSGLHTGGARAAMMIRSAVVTATAVRVASAVGAHDRAAVEAGFVIRGAWQGAVRAGIERLALDGADAATWRVAGLISRADVGRVSLVADIDVLAGHGFHETSLSLCGLVRAGAAQLVGSVRIDGDRLAGSGVAMVARVHAHLALLAGYDDGVESLRAGAVIGWRGIEVAAGVSQHPVLGLSQGVSVACSR
jgi:hypothetical protein